MIFPPLIDIIRLEESKTYGIFGVFLFQGKAFCVTLERPWEENKKNVSCIPTGTYKANLVPSKHFKQVYLLENVPGRSEIEIHPGNTIYDTEGCIIVASSYGKLRSRNRAVLNSGDTFRMFMTALKGYDEIFVRVSGLW